MNTNAFKSKYKINKIGVANDTLTGRGGMSQFVKFKQCRNLPIITKIIWEY
jgi:hypothetical protein